MGINITRNNIKPRTELRKIITLSSLSDSKKSVWYELIDLSGDDDIAFIYNALSKDVNKLPFLTENITSKLKAINTRDASERKEIIEKEKNYLDQIS